jgi:hypothetical protein
LAPIAPDAVIGIDLVERDAALAQSVGHPETNGSGADYEKTIESR